MICHVKNWENLILHTQFEGSKETICQMCEAFLECVHLPKFLCPHSEHNKHALLQENVPMVQEILQKIGGYGSKIWCAATTQERPKSLSCWVLSFHPQNSPSQTQIIKVPRPSNNEFHKMVLLGKYGGVSF